MSDKAAYYLELDEDELYQALGGEMLARGSGVAGFDPERLRDFGRQHFARLRVDLAAVLCNSDGSARLPAADITALAAAIVALDVAAGISAEQFEKSLILAALVYKMGVDKFCQRTVGQP